RSRAAVRPSPAKGRETVSACAIRIVIYLPNTVSSTRLLARSPKSPALAPPDQRFQGDDPDGSHDEIIWSLDQNRPTGDDGSQRCDERGPENDEQQDDRDSSELARRGGGRLRHCGGAVAEGGGGVCMRAKVHDL